MEAGKKGGEGGGGEGTGGWSNDRNGLSGHQLILSISQRGTLWFRERRGLPQGHSASQRSSLELESFHFNTSTHPLIISLMTILSPTVPPPMLSYSLVSLAWGWGGDGPAGGMTGAEVVTTASGHRSAPLGGSGLRVAVLCSVSAQLISGYRAQQKHGPRRGTGPEGVSG